MAKIQDPTLEEMRAFLAKQFPDGSNDHEEGWLDFAHEEAIYWFAHNYHGGQWSDLYAALCASDFQPGPIAVMPVGEESMAAYHALVQEYTT